MKDLESTNAKPIQWFPGHMAKTRRLIKENLTFVDAVVELRDARIIKSSRNPEIDRLVRGKPRIIILNKSDLADPNITSKWIEFFKNKGIFSLEADCKSGKNLNKLDEIAREACKDKIDRNTERGMGTKPLRLMVVGIPNVGKSSMINRLSPAKKTNVEDRPGVTRTKQWVKTINGTEILDMPGVLWPKFDDQTVGRNLALTGAIKDQILDIEDLAYQLINLLKDRYPNLLKERYKLSDEDLNLDNPWDIVEKIGINRGMKARGGDVDFNRASIMLLDEFRAGKIGRISLERVL